MARLFTDGAEYQDTMFFDSVLGTTLGVTNTPTPPKSPYCYWIQGDAGFYKNMPYNMSEVYMRFRARSEDWSAYNDEQSFPWFYKDAQWVMRVYGVGNYLTWATPTGIIATDTYHLMNATWYLIEMHLKIGTSDGRIRMKVNGWPSLDFTGNTQYLTNTNFNQMLFRSGGWFAGSVTWYLDDIAINDTTGDADNSWPGAGAAELLMPNANGDTLQWTSSSGSAFEDVNELPQNNDTDYIQAPTYPTKQELLHLATFDGTNKIVDRVIGGGTLRDVTGGNGAIKFGVKTGGGVYIDTGYTRLTDTFKRVAGDSWRLNPATGLPWTTADLNALQIALETKGD